MTPPELAKWMPQDQKEEVPLRLLNIKNQSDCFLDEFSVND
ncbi:hypothetical protein DES45_11469 [Microvirga subterranea]|uniref:Uncharacterized protein n=1 Tax=Microvirga subterranea TaxID=186651 RepID=A0A370H7I0_9HYPH|nr:hypothetical protein DES45_11469 [Microvirga subterranea]